jgi:hypothetical protein
MTRSVRRLIMLCVVAAIAVGIAASVASANKPIRGCTKNYGTPTPATTANDMAADKNGDGLVCFSQVATGNGSDGHLNVVDNTTNSSK